MDIDQVEFKTNVFVLALRDVVVFPGMVVPLFVGREKSMNALNAAMAEDKQIFLVTQKNATEESPTIDNLYDIGVMANILQLLKLPDGTLKVLVEGVKRFELVGLTDRTDVLMADIQQMASNESLDSEGDALVRSIQERFQDYADMKKKVPTEVIKSVRKTREPNRLVDTISANLKLGIEEKQSLLEILSVNERLEHILRTLETELEMLESEQRINRRVKKKMDQTQRNFYLNTKLQAIHEELGEASEDGLKEFDRLKEQVEAAGMPEAALKVTHEELKRLKMMSPQSPEANIIRTYVEWMVAIPWKKRTRVSKDLQKAQTILDKRHYGLDKVKERIIEYLAVQKRVRKIKGPILCLVGPPGVGKTSLARSIAEATNRKYVRMSLGGVRDEAEIRGHRKTYLGALPGRIIQKMKVAGTRNPLFLLDEIDKMARDNRGDPASALLEVLDPEQNNAFNDHYLEVDYDLSDVMFVATSNSMDIPEALLDRMEIIDLAGYTENEKLNIADRHLLPRALKDHGLKSEEIEVTREAILEIIQTYTREAGVRLLDQNLAKICRKSVKELVTGEAKDSIQVTPGLLEKYLGVAKYRFGMADERSQIGQVAGLAWTRVGGDLLRIEATAMPGKGKNTSTGQLGSVMQESTQAAMSVIRSRSKELGLDDDFYEKQDIHLHFPEGAIKKDGPSAGIAICTAIASVLTNIAVRSDVAMTGEITLRGEVLPIGGLKEKLLAAARGGIKTVLIPYDNVRDLAEIADEVKSGLDIHPVQWIDEVFKIALERLPKSREAGASEISMGEDLEKIVANKPSDKQIIKKTAKRH
ncbi:MAG: endopeptidase La [Piscirickettsiaceae bacterium CG_4_9_14_3_um_filter_43_564]|nr:endopeptidase La [Thiomicrospira sp.]OIP94332.1 MAG: endopeptidase La [Thiomicrospira sp. CG2_30_44_34]PIQ02576.1 MAG: endopeptidase La [Piscirickettsiaceae bacterium CG18_big_fil_WC_8_21_14_2_50_44_103]PIU39557.1 MAG: endopeptidase La [Piscirickettsiaceae bacterium CG07_land_8_20_14_0_80_44_28]PIW57574.1 MAG: endopeptidase La [Piscirickettsiaceae bacterium CG12_big_fil_rev_8_21_14_0_65_44_934]PIW77858.1 MAG: endopeptidase La [Piscirickettsiaceae bacterium CG_4_8_14_3_um_filter_44_38]PIX80